MKKNVKKIKMIAPTVLLACALLLSSCSTRTGEKADNVDGSTGELISVEPADRLGEETIKNIKNFVKNAPAISNITLPDNITVPVLETELENRKNNFVFANKEEQVLANDKVNLTFIDVSLDSGKTIYELNVGYDFDLNDDYDPSFKNGIVGHKVGEKFEIDNCKMPDGKTAKVKVKVNYITRKVSDFSVLDAKLPEGAESYSKWLENALAKSAKVNAIWEQLLSAVTVDETSEEYKTLYSEKYNNAYEYFKAYSDQAIDEAALKATIAKQCKKAFISYYYARELDVDFGDYKDDELETYALFYGYTLEGFKAKYSKDVINDTIFLDSLGEKFLKELEG